MAAALDRPRSASATATASATPAQVAPRSAAGSSPAAPVRSPGATARTNRAGTAPAAPSHPARSSVGARVGARTDAPAMQPDTDAPLGSATALDDALAAFAALSDGASTGDPEPPLPPHLAALLADAQRATAACDALTAAERAASSTPTPSPRAHASAPAASDTPAAPGGAPAPAPALVGPAPDLASRVRAALARSARHYPDLDDLDADDQHPDDLAAGDPGADAGDAPDLDADPRPHDFGGRAALREQAWTLHCQGMRAPAIARELDVPERTIRRWLAAIQDEVAAEHPARRADQLLHAVESLRELLAATWQAYHDERDLDAHLTNAAMAEAYDLNALRGEPNTTGAIERAMRRRSAGPRYLTLALAIQKETNRLLGLHRPAAAHEAAHESAPAATSSPLNRGAGVPPAAALPAATSSPLNRGAGGTPASDPASKFPAISATRASAPPPETHALPPFTAPRPHATRPALALTHRARARQRRPPSPQPSCSGPSSTLNTFAMRL